MSGNVGNARHWWTKTGIQDCKSAKLLDQVFDWLIWLYTKVCKCQGFEPTLWPGYASLEDVLFCIVRCGIRTERISFSVIQLVFATKCQCKRRITRANLESVAESSVPLFGGRDPEFQKCYFFYGELLMNVKGQWAKRTRASTANPWKEVCRCWTEIMLCYGAQKTAVNWAEKIGCYDMCS